MHFLNFYFYFTCFLAVLGQIQSQDTCQSRDFGLGGTVCVCDSNYCDEFPTIKKVNKPDYEIYTSNQAGLRFNKVRGTFEATNRKLRLRNEIFVKDEETYQEILGFGGALTDSAGYNLFKLSEDLQEKLLRSYYSEDGLQYNLVRVPMGGTDFSLRAYSYHDFPEDKNLGNFSLAPEDYDFKIPILKKAKELNPELKLFASAWTAPKWMKFNEEYSGMFGFLKEDMYDTWAKYFLKFLEHYRKAGLEFWAISTGNEPSLAFFPITINSVAWTPWQMKRWISNNLGPTIGNSSFSNITIMALDDQRPFLPWYIDIIFEDESVKDFIDGIAVHWYRDRDYTPELLTRTRNSYPDKFLLSTEACKGDLPDDAAVELGSWQRGEDYAFSIIEDMNHWVGGWVDWNIALNVSGGPTYVGNEVDSPIIVNAEKNEFYKQPMYYVLGHFSRFVPPGSRRIYTKQTDFNVPLTAFKRPDGGVVVVVLNKYENSILTVIHDEKRGDISLELTGKSISSILYW